MARARFDHRHAIQAMIPDWELWACANKMIEQHGDGTVTHAAMRGRFARER